jgi:iron complex outermembrane recepter protein
MDKVRRRSAYSNTFSLTLNPMLFANNASMTVARGRARCAPSGRISAARGFATRSILLGAGAVAAAFGGVGIAQGDAVSMSTLKTLSIEDLMKIEVTSVSKTGEPLSDAAAAVYVITREDILNSGAKSLPDILRVAPNLQVAQITASTFAITARGFNGPLASKLLVLVDGRSVYTPLYSGVLWDAQDVLPEDIERIEVISGPGATLWGANAVNGVISITTRKSTDTLGGSLKLGGGNLEQRGSLQYGGKLGDAVRYRAYVDSFHYGHDVTALGGNAQDDWHKSQGGFRLDWGPPGDLMTLQGDFYDGSEDKLTTAAQTTSGRNVLARWNHAFAGGSGLQIQAYYDYTAYAPTVLSSTQVFLFSPQRRTLNLANIFVQDSISLTERLKLILGTKLGHVRQSHERRYLWRRNVG